MDVEVRRSLGFDDGETDARVRALSERLAADEARPDDGDGSSRRWWRSFARPPPRMHAQERLLSGSKDAGGNRDQAQKRYLAWMRETQRDFGILEAQTGSPSRVPCVSRSVCSFGRGDTHCYCVALRASTPQWL